MSAHESGDLGDLLRQADLHELGDRIRRARLGLSLTQAQVARGEISVAYVSRIESGTRRPELAVLTLMADRLNTTVEHLLTGTPPDHAANLRLTVKYAELALQSGEGVEAERVLAEVLADPASHRVAGLMMAASIAHARALEVLGRLDDAAAELEPLRAMGDAAVGWSSAMIVLSRCYRESGDLQRAIDVAEHALEKLSAAGLEAAGDYVELELAVAAAYFERGDELHAVTRCREAARRAEAMQSPRLRASAYWNASVMESERGRHDNAIALADRALALLSEGEDNRNLARLRLQLGIMMLRAPDMDHRQAEKHIRRARRDLANSSGGAVDLARCDVHLAHARLYAGDLTAAEDLATSGLAQALDTAPLLAAEAHVVLGRAAAARGATAEAVTHYRSASASLTAAQADRGAAQAWYDLGSLLDDAGDHDLARQAFRSAAAASGLRTPVPNPAFHG